MRDAGRALSTGERVAWYRRRRGLSQEVLAGLTGRTTDWLSKVENGRANLDRLSVITSLAEALDVTVGDLLGEPSLMQWQETPAGKPVTLLRETLMDYPSLIFSSTPPDEIPAVADLRAGVDAVWSAYQAARFGYVTSRLPQLLSGARIAARDSASDDDRREAQRMLALTYHAAAATLGKVGESELAWIASDRGLAAAQASDDPKVVAALLRSVAHSMLTGGRHRHAADVVTQASGHLGRGPAPDDPTWWSLLGSLYLVGAMAAARADQPASARQFLAQVSPEPEL